MNRKEAEKTRTVQFVFSDETRDTYGTVLSADKWDLKRFNRIGVEFNNHNGRSRDPDQTIGTARAWIEDKKLVGEIRFEAEDLNPLADKVFRKVLAGTRRGVSVGFMPLERGKFGEGDEALGGKKETYYFARWELLEISVTPLPANKNALARSIGTDPIGETMERMSADGDICTIEDQEPDTNADNDQEEREADKDRALALDLMCRTAITMSNC